jgi:hypothetical protein
VHCSSFKCPETAGLIASFSLFARDSYGVLNTVAGEFRFELLKAGIPFASPGVSGIRGSVQRVSDNDGSYAVSYLATTAGFFSIRGTLTQVGGLSATFYNSRLFRMTSFDQSTGKPSASMPPLVCSFFILNSTGFPPMDNCTGSAIFGNAQYMRSPRFSARFSGYIQPLFSETYTLSLISSDYVSVWVDGVSIIKRTAASAINTLQIDGTVALQAMTMYPLVLEYVRSDDTAMSIVLKWRSRSQSFEVLPSDRMYDCLKISQVRLLFH